MHEPDVIILGAGVAGLAAAAALARAGKHVLVLEARNRLGGRIHTIRDLRCPIPLEMGAEFIHGRPPATLDLLGAAGKLVCELPFDHHEHTSAGLRHIADFDARIAPAMSGLARLGRRDRSFADYLRHHTSTGASARSQALARSFVEGFDAADPELISAKSIAEEQEGLGAIDSEPQHRVVDGYCELVDFLRQSCPRSHVSFRLRTAAREIQWTPGHATVHARAGTRSLRFSAPRVVITLPVGILQLPADSPHALRLTPEVPIIRRALGHLASGCVIKVLLLFHEPVWQRRLPSSRPLSFIHAPSLPFQTIWTARPLNVPLLTCWTGGPKALALSGTPTRDLVRLALDSLASVFHIRRAPLANALSAAHACDWSADPHARGAYSYLRVGGSHARRDLSRPIDNTLYFAGEAADTSGQASTVAGAISSGQRAAAHIVATDRKPSRRSVRRHATK